MSMNVTLGIVGMGFVGNSVYHTFSPYYKTRLYDKFKLGFEDLETVVNDSDIIFICVPTPVNSEGKQDLSCVYDTLDSISIITKENKIIIIRSTIIPGTTRKLSEKYQNFHFVFCPEFLTQRTAIFDSINAHRIILGGNNLSLLNTIESIFRKRYQHTLFFKTSFEAAELVKYVSNCFFSVKVSYMNEIYEICEKMGLNYDDIKKMFVADGRVGNSHIDVPGPDGDFGFGGKCFPKDLKSFISFAKNNLGLEMTMFDAANNVNERVRKNKDWLEIKGATSENNYE